MESFRELKVWEKAMAFVTDIYTLTREFPDSEKYGLMSQLRRAAVSIPSNIAEGWGRNSTKEYLQFLYIARGSLMETITQLEISCNLSFIKQERLKEIQSQAEEIGKMLNGLINALRSKK